MNIQIRVVDESFGSVQQQPELKPFRLELVSETLSARQIICERARAHFETIATELDVSGTTRLDIARRLTSGCHPPASIEQAEKEAIEGFQRHRYFFFWNDRQVLSLEERLQVLGENTARFIKLMPLQGG
jgi:hypothetical protein